MSADRCRRTRSSDVRKKLTSWRALAHVDSGAFSYEFPMCASESGLMLREEIAAGVDICPVIVVAEGVDYSLAVAEIVEFLPGVTHHHVKVRLDGLSKFFL